MVGPASAGLASPGRRQARSREGVIRHELTDEDLAALGLLLNRSVLNLAVTKQ